MKKMKLGFKLSAERKERLAKRLLENRRLFFLVLCGGLLVYSFNLVYRKAYVEVNYIQYEPEGNAFVASRESLTLGKIMQNIETRAKALEADKGRSFPDPFNYKQETAAPTKEISAPAAPAD